MADKLVTLPLHYKPWPHQARAWTRRLTEDISFDFRIWGRQLGKDSDDIEFAMYDSYLNPGIQTAYVGLNNVWINNNIFKKVIGNPPRSFWAEYPEDIIHESQTSKEVFFRNNPKGVAEARIKFIGFQNDEQLIGSSYDRFVFSEASLYRSGAFSYIEPIWQQKIARGEKLNVRFNGTPRGTHNELYELLRTHTGEDDPEAFPGRHGDCFVDIVTIKDALIIDHVTKELSPLYTEEEIERLKDVYLRRFGNLNLYYQEYECKFHTVNAGLVYQAIQQLEEEKRYTRFSLQRNHPIYFAWDISSKDKVSDATSCVVWQQIEGSMFIYDCFETRGKSLIDCVREMQTKPYFDQIRFGALPWDSDRTASSMSPIEEVTKAFPKINWRSLQKERVDRGIQVVRNQLPNMWINSDNCSWLLECFNNYEYKRLEAADDWAAKPMHNRYSHLMDAVRYACMANEEMKTLKLNLNGAYDFHQTGYNFVGSTPKNNDDGYSIFSRSFDKPKKGGPRYGTGARGAENSIKW